jgi:hypothetical protein
MPRITWEAFPALMMPVILLGCSTAASPRRRSGRRGRGVRAAGLRAPLSQHRLARHLPLAPHQRAHHHLDRHADRRRLVFNYVITAENIPKVLSAALSRPTSFRRGVPVRGQHPAARARLLPGGHDHPAGDRAGAPAHCQGLGIDPVHFGVVVVVNVMIGLVTPPYGLLLFMMSKIAEIPLKDLVREVLPFLWVMIGALAVMTYVPEVVLWLPRLLGYKG